MQEIDQFITQDIRERILAPTMRIKDPQEKAAARATAASELLPAKLALLEAQIGPSGFFVGDSPTLADLQFYTMANWLGIGGLERRGGRAGGEVRVIKEEV